MIYLKMDKNSQIVPLLSTSAADHNVRHTVQLADVSEVVHNPRILGFLLNFCIFFNFCPSSAGHMALNALERS